MDMGYAGSVRVEENGGDDASDVELSHRGQLSTWITLINEVSAAALLFIHSSHRLFNLGSASSLSANQVDLPFCHWRVFI
jgi:hypothetical protein